MELKNLHVVALVQDDETGEILQGVQVLVNREDNREMGTEK